LSPPTEDSLPAAGREGTHVEIEEQANVQIRTPQGRQDLRAVHGGERVSVDPCPLRFLRPLLWGRMSSRTSPHAGSWYDFGYQRPQFPGTWCLLSPGWGAALPRIRGSLWAPTLPGRGASLLRGRARLWTKKREKQADLRAVKARPVVRDVPQVEDAVGYRPRPITPGSTRRSSLCPQCSSSPNSSGYSRWVRMCLGLTVP
jgi:hypothetical protein